MISEVNRAITQRAFKRIGILGTRTVMETRLYGGVSGVEVVTPSGQDLEDVHAAYVAMAASGIVTEAQSAVFTAVSKRLRKESGVEAIVLGGTDLALLQRARHRISAHRLRRHPCGRHREIGRHLRLS
jgi:aspartate racemase